MAKKQVFSFAILFFERQPAKCVFFKIIRQVKITNMMCITKTWSLVQVWAEIIIHSWCTLNISEKLFFFFIGVAFIFLMPIGYGVLEYSHKTYFSENALLPGLVKVEFNMEHVARQYLEDLRHSINIRTVRSLPLLSSLLNWFKLVCGPLRQSNMH